MDIEADITRSLRKTPISSGENLLGFPIDVDHYLEDSGYFQDIHFEDSIDPRFAIIVRCRVSDPSAPMRDIARILENIWLEDLQYSYSKSHSMNISEKMVSLRFLTITGPSKNHLCVIGIIEVIGYDNHSEINNG